MVYNTEQIIMSKKYYLLFICALFNDAVHSLDYKVLNDRMISE
jgi:hypothetical protein